VAQTGTERGSIDALALRGEQNLTDQLRDVGVVVRFAGKAPGITVDGDWKPERIERIRHAQLPDARESVVCICNGPDGEPVEETPRPWLEALIAGTLPTRQRIDGMTQLPATVTPENVITSASVAMAPRVAFTRTFAETTDAAGSLAESLKPVPPH
jgi:hypothetical protein